MSLKIHKTFEITCIFSKIVLFQATEQLKVLFKDPTIVTGLCQVLGTSQNPQVISSLNP